MLALLKQQNLKDMIPSGLPKGTITASKTGEMTEEQNPVLVENDIAVVFDSSRPYVICILSNCIRKNEQAQKTISQISSDVYQYMSSSTKADLYTEYTAFPEDKKEQLCGTHFTGCSFLFISFCIILLCFFFSYPGKNHLYPSFP